MKLAPFSLTTFTIPLLYHPLVVDGYDLRTFSLFEPLTLWDPSYTFSSWIQQPQDFFNNGFLRGTTTTTALPQTYYEIRNKDNKFELSLDIPGVKPEDVKVTFDPNENVLLVSGHRGEVVLSKDDDDNENRSYSSFSKFSRRFSVDTSVDVENLTAHLDHGVLTISAPQLEKKTVIEIPIVTTTTEEQVSISNTSIIVDNEYEEDKEDVVEELPKDTNYLDEEREPPSILYDNDDNDDNNDNNDIENVDDTDRKLPEMENPNQLLQDPGKEKGFRIKELRV